MNVVLYAALLVSRNLVIRLAEQVVNYRSIRPDQCTLVIQSECAISAWDYKYQIFCHLFATI